MLKHAIGALELGEKIHIGISFKKIA